MMRILSTRCGLGKPGRRVNKSLFLLLASALWFVGIVAAAPAQAASGSSPIPLADSPNITDWLSVAAEFLTAAGVAVAFIQLVISRNGEKRERTRAFQERFQSDGFSESASRTVGCMKVDDAGDCVRFAKAWSNRPNAMERVLPQPEGYTRASVHDIERTLTLFEEMGTAYKLKQLDEKTIQLGFAPVILQVFTITWWLICWQRGGHLSNEGNLAGKIWVEFEDMCAAIKKAFPALVKDLDLEPARAIRALCLPHGSEGEKIRSGATWSASRSLSLSLSHFARKVEPGRSLGSRLEALAAEVATLHAAPIPTDGPAPEKWDVILIPATIDQLPDGQWKTQRSASIRLAQALDRCAAEDKLDAAVAHLKTAAA
jgi:hypothetical protein